MPHFAPRLRWLLWLLVAAIYAVDVLTPISSRFTRASGVLLALGLGVALLVLVRKRAAVRYALLALFGAGLLLLALPARAHPDVSALRAAYARALERYAGVRYFWGGESPLGVDCSGLLRRGMIEALILRGLQAADPGLLRNAFEVWWHDCSADELKHGFRGFTFTIAETPSLRSLAPGPLQPGDMAVTSSGIHVIAYLGAGEWIEADPVALRVLRISGADTGNLWLNTRMSVLRWTMLREPAGK